jgi:hypothetical protein
MNARRDNRITCNVSRMQNVSVSELQMTGAAITRVLGADTLMAASVDRSQSLRPQLARAVTGLLRHRYFYESRGGIAAGKLRCDLTRYENSHSVMNTGRVNCRPVLSK